MTTKEKSGSKTNSPEATDFLGLDALLTDEELKVREEVRSWRTPARWTKR